MTRYLLAAEADQIQDFVFRAAHLREVVGGSQILTRFGDREEGAPPTLRVSKEDLVVSGGGNFRALFDTHERAIEFGEQLAEVYRLATDGSLTVIEEPVEADAGDDMDFARASRVAQEQLQRAKRWRSGSLNTAQLPYIAFCASCGIGLAAWHQKRHDRAGQAQYLCDACRAKGAERAEESLGQFLMPFVKGVVGQRKDPNQYIWPGKLKDRATANQEIDPTADLGMFDARSYVAYLVADGNNMGQVFDKCSKDQMRQLSEGMTDILRSSLAETTRVLRSAQAKEIAKIDPNFIPALPLILGGDDLFALLPAPWALDFARHFCEQFEERMAGLVDGLKLSRRAEPSTRITMAASVVVCKHNYPFYLAHTIGHERLEHAKELTKRLAKAQPNGDMHSVVDFEVILGSQTGAQPAKRAYRSTLRPYWITGGGVPEGWGLKLDTLLAQRWALRNLPRKRLAQLRALYYPSALPDKKGEASLARWYARRDALLRRIDRDEEIGQRVRQAFDVLGGAYWYPSRRTTEDDWYGHALPDLLEAWDFAYRLDTPKSDYEEI